MSHKIDRLQLIRERHRKVILEPRRKEHVDVFADWDDDFDPADDELLTRSFAGGEDDEE
jgi:hypothetical protein